MSDRESFAIDWTDDYSSLPNGLIGSINHPKHGLYYLWSINGLFGISRTTNPPHCGYSSLEVIFKLKNL